MHVRCDSSRVTIYRTGRSHYTVAWRLAGRRTRVSRSTLAEAKRLAEEKAKELADGRHAILELKAADRERFESAVASLATTGHSLDVACREFAEAWRLVQPASLIQVARWWKEHHSHELPEKPVPEIVEEFLRDREEAGVSADYMSNVSLRLRAFAARFPGEIRGVTAAMVEEFLRSKKFSPGSWNCYRTSIVAMFNYAKDRGYLYRDRDVEAKKVKVLKDRGKDIRTFAPSEIQALLDAAAKSDADLLPFIAIGAFAGVRRAEIGRLDWADIRWERGVIDVAKHKAKTAARRLVPIAANLAAWLGPFRGRTGRVVPSVRTPRRTVALARRIGLEWAHNVLRDSFISHRVAITQNLPQTALEAGNSPDIIRRHYLELRTPDEGKAWFSVMPNGAANVVLFAEVARVG